MKKLLWCLLIAWWWYPLKFALIILLCLVGYKWLWGGKETVRDVLLKEFEEMQDTHPGRGKHGVRYLIKYNDAGKKPSFKSLLKDLKPFIVVGNHDGHDNNVEYHWNNGYWFEIRVPIQFDKALVKRLKNLGYLDVNHRRTYLYLWYFDSESKYVNLGEH